MPFSSITTKSTTRRPIIPTSPGATACFAVYNYLANAKTGQAASPSTYGTNPLWGVVDGPWKLKSIDTSTGNTVFVPNAAYAGPQKPYLSEFEELGYQSDTAEYQALEAGSTVNVGYIPPQHVPQNAGNSLTAGPNAPALKGTYTFNLLYPFQISYFPLNLKKPTVGPIFSQQYPRAAMQSLIDQPAYIRSFDAGYGVPTFGPVPTVPPTYASKQEPSNRYPYSVSSAKQLLSSHGWTVVPHGTNFCSTPGTAANQCGAGIAKGEKFSFTLLWTTGALNFSHQLNSMISAWEQVGIHAGLKGESFSAVIAKARVNCEVTMHCIFLRGGRVVWPERPSNLLVRRGFSGRQVWNWIPHFRPHFATHR